MMVICNYCSKPASFVSGVDVYPHRPDLAEKRFYLCAPCDAFVGCHPGTHKPLGQLAKPELRKSRMYAHNDFDKLWKGGHMKRGQAYAWLATALNVREIHIGESNRGTCIRISNLSRAKLRELTGAAPEVWVSTALASRQ